MAALAKAITIARPMAGRTLLNARFRVGIAYVLLLTFAFCRDDLRDIAIPEKPIAPIFFMAHCCSPFKPQRKSASRPKPTDMQERFRPEAAVRETGSA
jgi:hypothetical protein